MALSLAAPSGCAVPWADLPPTHPDLPVAHVPRSPDPAVAEQSPPCRADQLVAGPVEGGGAGGTIFLTYPLSLFSGKPCRLSGTPVLTPLDNGSPVAVPVRAGAFAPAYHGAVRVSHGHAALLLVTWSADWCAPPLRVTTVRMTLPDGSSLDLGGPGRTPFCNGVPGSGPAPLAVNPFAPADPQPGHATSPWQDVRVRPRSVDLRAGPGERVEFVVTLVAGRDVPLDACPDYRIRMYGVGIGVQVEHALNCEGVPYRTAGGRPYLPARTPVPFTMEVTAPSSSVGKLVWELETPLRPVTVGGRLLVD